MVSPENAFNQGFENNFSIGLIKSVYAYDSPDINNQFTRFIYYPFRSLFTGRRQEELEFTVEDKGDYFSFTAKIPSDLAGGKLVVPELVKDEVTEYDAGDLKVTVEKLPEVYLDGELIQVPPASQAQSATPEVSLGYINEGNLEVRVPKINGYYSSNLSADAKALADKQPRSCDQFNRGVYTHEKIEEDGKSLLQLTSIGSSNCLDFDLGHLAQRYGYLVTVENRNIEGKSMLISFINKNSQRADIETYLPKNNEPKEVQPPGRLNLPRISYFVIPPMEPDSIGYTLHFDNISIGRVKTVNELGRITVNPIPYRFLTSLKIVTDSSTFKGDTLKGDIKVDHPNPSFYKVDLSSDSTLTSNSYLILSQSFDKGWKAYEISLPRRQAGNFQFPISNFLKNIFPFIFGKEIKNHVLINNWENGWDLSSTSYNLQPITIIIVYLPQYLEYIGFGLLFIFMVFLFLTREKKYFHGIKIEPIVN